MIDRQPRFTKPRAQARTYDQSAAFAGRKTAIFASLLLALGGGAAWLESPRRQVAALVSEYRLSTKGSAAAKRSMSGLLRKDPTQGHFEQARSAFQDPVLRASPNTRALLEKLASQDRFRSASTVMLGSLLLEQTDSPTSVQRGIQLHSAAAKRGSLQALVSLSRLHADGGLAGFNPRLSADFAVKAAEKRAANTDILARAAIALAENHIPDDHEKAREWAEQSASGQSIRGQLALARVAILMDDEKASYAALARASALARNTRSATTLTKIGRSFALGDGAPQDTEKAMQALAFAEAIGDPEAKTLRLAMARFAGKHAEFLQFNEEKAK